MSGRPLLSLAESTWCHHVGGAVAAPPTVGLLPGTRKRLVGGLGLAAPVLPRSGDLLAAAVCPHCQRDLAEYRFTTDDGLPIITYHCLEHGDVIPLRGILARDHPITEEEN